MYSTVLSSAYWCLLETRSAANEVCCNAYGPVGRGRFDVVRCSSERANVAEICRALVRVGGSCPVWAKTATDNESCFSALSGLEFGRKTAADLNGVPVPAYRHEGCRASGRRPPHTINCVPATSLMSRTDGRHRQPQSMMCVAALWVATRSWPAFDVVKHSPATSFLVVPAPGCCNRSRLFW